MTIPTKIASSLAAAALTLTTLVSCSTSTTAISAPLDVSPSTTPSSTVEPLPADFFGTDDKGCYLTMEAVVWQLYAGHAYITVAADQADQSLAREYPRRKPVRLTEAAAVQWLSTTEHRRDYGRVWALVVKDGMTPGIVREYYTTLSLKDANRVLDMANACITVTGKDVTYRGKHWHATVIPDALVKAATDHRIDVLLPNARGRFRAGRSGEATKINDRYPWTEDPLLEESAEESAQVKQMLRKWLSTRARRANYGTSWVMVRTDPYEDTRPKILTRAQANKVLKECGSSVRIPRRS